MPIALSTARSAPISAAAYNRFFTPSQQSETSAPVTLTDYLLRIQEYGARLHFTRNEIPTTVLVSRGSIIPSSQSRAVA